MKELIKIVVDIDKKAFVDAGYWKKADTSSTHWSDATVEHEDDDKYDPFVCYTSPFYMPRLLIGRILFHYSTCLHLPLWFDPWKELVLLSSDGQIIHGLLPVYKAIEKHHHELDSTSEGFLEEKQKIKDASIDISFSLNEISAFLRLSLAKFHTRQVDFHENHHYGLLSMTEMQVYCYASIKECMLLCCQTTKPCYDLPKHQFINIWHDILLDRHESFSHGMVKLIYLRAKKVYLKYFTDTKDGKFEYAEDKEMQLNMSKLSLSDTKGNMNKNIGYDGCIHKYSST